MTAVTRVNEVFDLAEQLSATASDKESSAT